MSSDEQERRHEIEGTEGAQTQINTGNIKPIIVEDEQTQPHSEFPNHSTRVDDNQDKDSIIDSYLSPEDKFQAPKRYLKKSSKPRNISPLKPLPTPAEEERTLSEKQRRLDELMAVKNQILMDMLVQCKINESQFNTLLEKKKRKKKIAEEIQGMTQQFMLMQRQVEIKKRKAKEYEDKLRQIDQHHLMKRQWEEMRENHRKKMEEVNNQKKEQGKSVRELCNTNRSKNLFEIYKGNRQKVLEEKERLVAFKAYKEKYEGVDSYGHTCKVRDSRAKQYEGEIVKKGHTMSKLSQLNNQIVSKIDAENKDIDHLHENMMNLVNSQRNLKKKLDTTSMEFETKHKELSQRIKLDKLSTRSFKERDNVSESQDKKQFKVTSSRDKLGFSKREKDHLKEIEKETIKYKFGKFQEKTDVAEFLFEQEKKARNNPNHTQETSIRKEVEVDLDQLQKRSKVHGYSSTKRNKKSSFESTFTIRRPGETSSREAAHTSRL